MQLNAEVMKYVIGDANMAMCSFCNFDILRGTGTLYAKKDGTIYYFCSSKCRKNQLNLRREGRRQKWTKASRLFKEREAKKVAEEKKKENKG